MTETVLIYDEDEARALTEAQMRLTARRYGIGGHELPAELPRESPPMRFESTPFPAQVAPDVAHLPLQVQMLLLTPSALAGQVRLVRMQGTQKVGSWTLAETAADTVAAILGSFGITLTDLRESEEDMEQSS